MVTNIKGEQIKIKEKSVGYFFTKRVFDIVFSIFCLIVLSPIFILITILIPLTSKGGPFYVQTRMGLNGKKFKIIKFRSMIKNAEELLPSLNNLNETDGPTFKITNDPRVTKFGRFLRKTSLDELPQFFNIIVGHMSVVGPRPPLPLEVKNYDEFASLRLLAKPGLTCIWQCSGRSSLKFSDWMKMDVEYLQKRSLLFDLKLILMTIPAVFSGKGAW